MRGEGVAQDADQAVSWFRAAAAQGHTIAKIYLGVQLAEGTTGPPDIEQALKLLDEAQAAREDVTKVRALILKESSLDLREEIAKVREAICPGASEQFDDDSDEPDDLDALLNEPTPFRRACSFFAFHLLPEWLFEAHRPTSFVSVEQIRARVPEMWREAHRLDQASGVHVWKIDEEPICHEAPSRIVIDMPRHGLPPEPRWVVIDVSSFPARVLLVESFLTREARGLLSEVDAEQRHGVHGLLPDRDLATALATCAARNIPELPPLEPLLLLRHLMLYAQEVNDLARARGERSGPV